jgi:hypothetical protein
VSGNTGSIVYDFDEVCESPIRIRLLSRDRHILPISLEKYAAYVNKFSLLNAGLGGSPKNSAELAEEWHEYLSAFIEPLDLEEVKKMSVAQIAMCFSAIVRRVQGESAASLADLSDPEVKKKTPLTQKFP